MKNRYLILLAGLLVAGSLLLVACGDKNDKPADTQAPTAAQTNPATDPTDETTAPADDTTVAEGDTTVAEDDTTVAEDDTTVAEDDTTVAEDDTTVAEDDTTETDTEVDTEAEDDTDAPEDDDTAFDSWLDHKDIVKEIAYDAAYLNGNTTASIKPLENEDGTALILGLDDTATTLELLGWAALAKENYSFAYVIDNGEIVTDPSFITAAEQDVINKITEAGAVAGNRFTFTVDIAALEGYHTIQALVEVDGVYYVMAELSFYKVSANEPYIPPYAGFAETINDAGFALGWDEVFGYRTVTEDGITTVVTEYAGITPLNNQLTLKGIACVDGGQDKLLYSIDGENWIEIAEQSLIVNPDTGSAFWQMIWSLRGGLYNFTETTLNFVYNATIDLSEYAGQTVDVHVAVRSAVEYDGAQQICPLFTLTGVVVEAAE